jgi:hypothetical protein
MVLFLRVYAPEGMAEYPVTNRKGNIKPLKIRPSAIKPIDIVLRRSTGPDPCRQPVEDAACGDDILMLVPCKLFLCSYKKGRPPRGIQSILTVNLRPDISIQAFFHIAFSN